MTLPKQLEKEREKRTRFGWLIADGVWFLGSIYTHKRDQPYAISVARLTSEIFRAACNPAFSSTRLERWLQHF